MKKSIEKKGKGIRIMIKNYTEDKSENPFKYQKQNFQKKMEEEGNKEKLVENNNNPLENEKREEVKNCKKKKIEIIYIKNNVKYFFIIYFI